MISRNFRLSAKICLRETFNTPLPAKINPREIFANKIQIRLNFTFGLKSQNYIKVIFYNSLLLIS